MPRLWAATGDPRSTAECGRRGTINTLVLRGPVGTKKAWDSYKQARRDAGLPPAARDRFAYAAMVYVGGLGDLGFAAVDLWGGPPAERRQAGISTFVVRTRGSY